MTRKVVIFGNSGSGKSTLAKNLAKHFDIAHFDLDLVAWQDVTPPTRQMISKSRTEIEQLTAKHENWLFEGCYADLLEILLPSATHMIFLNLPIATCIANAKNRPWEPHKYDSPEAQDKNLDMLINWISDYETRDDLFSRQAHQALFDQFKGHKCEIKSNPGPEEIATLI